MSPCDVIAALNSKAFKVFPWILVTSWASLRGKLQYYVRWLRNWGYRPIQYGVHINIKHLRSFTTFICCECAYVRVLSILQLLLHLTKLSELTSNSGYLLRVKQQLCVLLLRLLTHSRWPTSISNTYKVFHNLHMLLMCLWTSCFTLQQFLRAY